MAIAAVTYLEEAVEKRVVPMLIEASTVLDVPLAYRKVYTFYDDKNPPSHPPFWWVYPGENDTQSRAGDQATSVYVEYVRFVGGKIGDRIPGKWSKQLRLFLPTLRHYFEERPSLVYQSGQPKMSNLVKAQLGAFTMFGVFDDGSEDVGSEAPLTLTFRNTHTRFPGN